MAKEAKGTKVIAEVIHRCTGEVLATGKVDLGCESSFVADMGRLVEDARERMRVEVSGDGRSGSATAGFTAAFGKGYDGIVWNNGKVGEA